MEAKNIFEHVLCVIRAESNTFVAGNMPFFPRHFGSVIQQNGQRACGALFVVSPLYIIYSHHSNALENIDMKYIVAVDMVMVTAGNADAAGGFLDGLIHWNIYYFLLFVFASFFFFFFGYLPLLIELSDKRILLFINFADEVDELPIR